MSNNQYRSSYVPAVPDDVLAPPPAPLPDAPLVRDSVRAENAWFVLTFANVLVATIIVAGMLVDGSTTGRAILYGSLYFFFTMTIFVLALTGTLTDIVRGRQREITERERIAAYADLGEQAIRWRVKVEDNRRREIERDSLPSTLARRLTQLEAKLDELGEGDAEGMQPPSYVSAYDNRGQAAFAQELHPADTTRDEAVAWARKLYNDLGEPHPHYVQLSGKESARGRIQHTEIIGSARGAGSAEARLWLLQRRVLLKRPGYYALNLKDFPTERELRYIE